MLDRRKYTKLEWDLDAMENTSMTGWNLDYEVTFKIQNPPDKNITNPQMIISLTRKSGKYFRECVWPVSIFVMSSWVRITYIYRVFDFLRSCGNLGR